MNKLADELLKEILSPPLRVNDDMFADTGYVSPFSKATSSASNVLLVCKRFMRVGTPALYETVVIRSTAQAQALQMALTRNPEFGRFVKKLRLEGVYGQYFTPAIVSVLTRVTDFCFTLSVYSSDKMAGLHKALVKFDPIRVILTLHDYSRTHNAQYRGLVDNLYSAIITWTKLQRFSFSGDCYLGRDAFITQSRLSLALGKCKTLQRVDVSVYWHEPLSEPTKALLTPNNTCKLVIHRPIGLRVVMDIPVPLRKRVFVTSSSSSSRLFTLDEADQLESVPRVTTSHDPFYVPMATIPRDVRLRIWSRVFLFSIKPAHSSQLDKDTAKSILLVSRDFHDAMLPIIFQDMSIMSRQSYEAWSRLLDFNRSASIGKSAKKLHFSMYDFHREEDFSPAKLFGHLSSLEEADFFILTPPLFEGLHALGSSAGKTLHKLSFRDPSSSHIWSTPCSLSVFADFIALTELSIEGEQARFTAAAGNSLFPNLRTLDVNRIHSSFYSSLCKATLPSLRVCRIRQAVKKADRFLRSHGSKLETLGVTAGIEQAHLNVMTSLLTLELFEDVQATVLSKLKHTGLQELYLHWIPRGTGLSRFRDMSRILPAAGFLALKKVVVLHGGEIWPTSERDIKRSSWPDMSTRLAEAGITLVDHTGRAWRPRLQVQ